MFAALIPLLGNLLDKIIPDPGMQAQAKLAIMQMAQTGELGKITAAAGVVTAEANSKYALAAIWRPITMLCFVAIVMNNQFVAPYLYAIFGWKVVTPLPPEMWELLKIGIGGYVVGRSAEKMVMPYVQSKYGPKTDAQVPPVNLNGG